MKFGKVNHPENIDFSMPSDHPETKKVVKNKKNANPLKVYVGCVKWNRQDLKGLGTRLTIPQRNLPHNI